ncbi:universal stress protein [Croceiramulus getboli]|nr:universal stress protein [Flavobacteriaceae bacterium YJPT1-3]
MRTIIFPTDFSDCALNALCCAMQYFKYERTEFILLHTYAEEVYANDSLMSRELLEDFKQIKKKEAEQGLQRVFQDARKMEPNPRHQFSQHARFGLLLDEVNDLVNALNADLIVMGTQGKTASKTITYGSNTLQVMKYVKCPVLAVPASFTYHRPTHVLFPSDLMIPFKARELKLIACLAKSFRSTLHLLHLSKSKQLSIRQEDVKSQWEESFRESKTEFVMVSEGDRAERINDYIEHHQINLLVMVNFRHTYMESLLINSTIDQVGLNTQIPFLVLQNLPR